MVFFILAFEIITFEELPSTCTSNKTKPCSSLLLYEFSYQSPFPIKPYVEIFNNLRKPCDFPPLNYCLPEVGSPI